jgi:hypothetical protein
MTGLNLVNELERAFLNAGWFTMAPSKTEEEKCGDCSHHC